MKRALMDVPKDRRRSFGKCIFGVRFTAKHRGNFTLPAFHPGTLPGCVAWNLRPWKIIHV
jgi:hypothetical protein